MTPADRDLRRARCLECGDPGEIARETQDGDWIVCGSCGAVACFSNGALRDLTGAEKTEFLVEYGGMSLS